MFFLFSGGPRFSVLFSIRRVFRRETFPNVASPFADFLAGFLLKAIRF
jgi:hypothetical protein